MIRLPAVASVATLILLVPLASAGVEYRTLHDDARDRDVPIKLYTPEDDSGTDGRPLVVFSHGMGGSVEAATYLGEAMAAHGYVFAAVQHAGSDEGVWKGLPPRDRLTAIRKGANGRQLLDRAADVTFAVTALLADPSLRIDPRRVGVAGHSFGSVTAMAVAGARWGVAPDLADLRVRAALSMSGRGTKVPGGYDGVSIPILHTCGSDETSLIDPDVTVADRRYSFDHVAAPGQFLVTFDGAGHGVFSGTALRGERADADLANRVHAGVVAAALAFFDATLAREPTLPSVEALRAAVDPREIVEVK